MQMHYYKIKKFSLHKKNNNEMMVKKIDANALYTNSLYFVSSLHKIGIITY